MSSPSGNRAKRSDAPIVRTAASTSSSVADGLAMRMFERIVPPNRKPSCGTTITRWRSECMVASAEVDAADRHVPVDGS